MISVAMTTYNGGRYIREQLDSVLSQSLRDFELVVCDDCSADDTWDILEKYGKRDERIRIYRNKVNLGFKRNFEEAVKLCRGEFVAFCDQDDIWTANHLEVLYNNIGDKAVCVANAAIIDGNGREMGFKLSDFMGIRHFPEKDLDKAYVLFYFLNPFPGCNTMFRKSFLDFAYPIRDGRIRYHDSYALALACVSEAGLVYVDEVTMLYRFHKESVTSGAKRRMCSPYRCCLRKLATAPHARSNYVPDRIYFCREILGKNANLTREQHDFLTQAFRYHARRDKLWGRLLNFMFDLRHFRVMYMR